MVNIYPVDDDAGTRLTKGKGGVLDISNMEKHNNSASRMLKLQASVVEAQNRLPKPFKCAARVRLPDGDELIHYGATLPVKVVSELH